MRRRHARTRQAAGNKIADILRNIFGERRGSAVLPASFLSVR